jgi:hypothetical protein
VDSQQAHPASGEARSGLLRRIEAIAAEVGPERDAPAVPSGSLDALASRLEKAFEERLAAEMAALREDLADAIEELSASLLERISAIHTELLAASVYPKSSDWQG